MNPEHQNDNEAFFSGLSPERKKLYWRSIKRGVKEADLMFTAFARRRLHLLDTQELKEYEKLVETSDADLMPMLIGTVPVSEELAGKIFDELRSYQAPER